MVRTNASSESNSLLPGAGAPSILTNNINDIVARLRERVLGVDDDLRDVVATLLSENQPLIAGQLVASLRDSNIPEYLVKDSEAEVRTFCRTQISGTAAADDPIRFTDLVEALAAIEPGNINVLKSVERGYTLLLNHARRSLTRADLPRAISLARRAAAANAMTQQNRMVCAEVLENCGRPDEAAVLLHKRWEYDESRLQKITALLNKVDNWSGLYDWLGTLRESTDFAAILGDVARRISAQLSKDIENKDALHLLNTALALAAASEESIAGSVLVSAVLKRSRRAIRQIGRGDYPLLEEMCKKHLVLCPEDRDVCRRYVRLLLARRSYGVARDELVHQLQRDPHDEGMWGDLSKCCAVLGLKDEASVAERRSLSMMTSGDFDTAELSGLRAGK